LSKSTTRGASIPLFWLVAYFGATISTHCSNEARLLFAAIGMNKSEHGII
jgi:hypothetical protein